MSFESFKTRLVAKINDTFPTPLSRLAAVWVALAVAAFAITTEAVRALLPAVLTCAAIYSLAKHFASRKPPARRRTLKSVVTFVRRLRQTFAIGWEVEMMHLTVLMIGFVLLIFQACWPRAIPALIPAIWAVGVTFVLAGAVDAARIAIAIAKFAWARWTGKALYAAVAAFSVWAGDVLSKKVVAQATGLDPEHFVATERLIHWLATPAIGLAVIVAVLSTVSLAAYAIIMVGSMLAQHFRMIAFAMPRFTSIPRKASVAYRLMHGKNRLRGTSAHIFQWESAVRMMRPAAVSLAGAGVLWCLGQLEDLPMATVGPVIRGLVVQIEFNPGQKCGSTVVAEPSDHLEEGKMAVAVRLPHDWTFEPDVCEVEKRKPKQE
jgi:hypothetical protein